MAARSFVQLLGAADPGVVLLGISFFPQGTGTISSSQIIGRGVQSVAWVAAGGGNPGRYRVTLTDVYANVLSVTATLQLATAAGQFCQIYNVNLANRTIDIVVWDITGAAATSVAANAGNEINVVLVLKNSQV